MEIHTITLERWMCRICLEKGTYNIFDDELLIHPQGQLPTVSSGCSSSISIIEALNYFGEFKISKPETVDEPVMLCETCYAELAKCVQFRRKLNDSEMLLHKDYATVFDTDEETEDGKTGLTMHMVDIEPFLEEDAPLESLEFAQEPLKQPKIHHAKPRFQLTNQVSNILRHVATTSSSRTSDSSDSTRAKRKEFDAGADSETPKKIHRRDSQDNQLEKTLIVPNYIFTREVSNQQEKNVLVVERTNVPPDAESIPCENDLDRSDTDEVFYCKHCPKAFSARYHLVVHTKNVHLCQYCLKYFGTILARNKHVREEHKSFRCSLCTSFQSRYATNLRAHLRKVHSVALPAHVSILQPQDVVGNK